RDPAGLVDVDPGGVQPDLVGVGYSAGGDQDRLGGDGLLDVGGGEADAVARGGQPGAAEVADDAQLAEAAVHRAGEHGRHLRQDPGLHLEQRDLRAEFGERGGELDADVAGADDRDRAG